MEIKEIWLLGLSLLDCCVFKLNQELTSLRHEMNQVKRKKSLSEVAKYGKHATATTLI